MTQGNDYDDERLHKAVEQWNSVVGKRLLRSLTPIYREGPRHPELIGSGTLLRIADMTFLVTAAHVADEVKRGPYYFGAADMLIPLGGLKMSSPLPVGVSRDEDRTDLAYWVLDPSVAGKLSSADTLRPGDLELDSVSEAFTENQYLVNGYPASRQPRRLTEGEFAARPFSFITEEESARSYEAINLDRTRNLFVSFDKDDTYRQGAKVTGPDLFGISGCGFSKFCRSFSLNSVALRTVC